MTSRVCLALSLMVPVWATAPAQSQRAAQPSKWAFTLDLGAYAVGNREAMMSWLRRNAYGAVEPPQCGFDPLFRRSCDPEVQYPRATGTGLIGGIASLRRSLSDQVAIQVFAATEQSGDVVGRCDDLAVPKDARCKQRTLELTFGGGSFAALAVLTYGHLHVGAGPALFLANWQMQPAHLPGLWLDATLDREPWPWFLRAQYRVYGSTNLGPETGFTAFHPSTLFLGGGFTVRPSNTTP